MRHKTSKTKNSPRTKTSSKNAPLKSASKSSNPRSGQTQDESTKTFLDGLKAAAKEKRREQYKIAKANLKTDPRYKDMMAKKKELEKKLRKDLAERKKKSVATKKAAEKLVNKSSLAKEKTKLNKNPINQTIKEPMKQIMKDNNTKLLTDVDSIDIHLQPHPLSSERLDLDLEILHYKKPNTKNREKYNSSFKLSKEKPKRDKFKSTKSQKSSKQKPLFRTGSNPELRALAEIIDVDFINKKRQYKAKK